jgi:PIN domain nuclease of toxin-antitoxin system
MPRNPSFFYWDSCVFLSYINGIEDRLQQIEDVWAEIAEDDEKRIVTSAISVAEVAYLITEKEQGRLDPNVETSINAMWYNPSVSLVEVSPPISFLARKLMRDVVPNGWVLKPHDAIHSDVGPSERGAGDGVPHVRRPIAQVRTYDRDTDLRATRAAAQVDSRVEAELRTCDAFA